MDVTDAKARSRHMRELLRGVLEEKRLDNARVRRMRAAVLGSGG